MKRGGGVMGARCGVELGAAHPWWGEAGVALDGGGTLLRCGRRKTTDWAVRVGWAGREAEA
jgi:hypothetical protein